MNKYRGGRSTRGYLRPYKQSYSKTSQAVKQNALAVSGQPYDKVSSIFQSSGSAKSKAVKNLYRVIPEMFYNPGKKKWYFSSSSFAKDPQQIQAFPTEAFDAIKIDKNDLEEYLKEAFVKILAPLAELAISVSTAGENLILPTQIDRTLWTKNLVVRNISFQQLLSNTEGLTESYMWYSANGYNLVADDFSVTFSPVTGQFEYEEVQAKSAGVELVNEYAKLQFYQWAIRSPTLVFADYDENKLLAHGMISADTFKNFGEARKAGQIWAQDQFALLMPQFCRTFNPAQGAVEVATFTAQVKSAISEGTIDLSKFNMMGQSVPFSSESFVSALTRATDSFKSNQYLTFSPKKTFKHAQFINRFFVISLGSGATESKMHAKIESRPLFRHVAYHIVPQFNRKPATTFYFKEGSWGSSQVKLQGAEFKTKADIAGDLVRVLQSSADKGKKAIVPMLVSWQSAGSAAPSFEPVIKAWTERVGINVSMKQVQKILSVSLFQEYYKYAISTRYGASIIRLTDLVNNGSASYVTGSSGPIQFSPQQLLGLAELESATSSTQLNSAASILSQRANFPWVVERLRKMMLRYQTDQGFPMSIPDTKQIRAGMYTNQNLTQVQNTGFKIETTWSSSMPDAQNGIDRAMLTAFPIMVGKFVSSFRQATKRSGGSIFAWDNFIRTCAEGSMLMPAWGPRGTVARSYPLTQTTQSLNSFNFWKKSLSDRGSESESYAKQNASGGTVQMCFCAPMIRDPSIQKAIADYWLTVDGQKESSAYMEMFKSYRGKGNLKYPQVASFVSVYGKILPFPVTYLDYMIGVYENSSNNMVQADEVSHYLAHTVHLFVLLASCYITRQYKGCSDYDFYATVMQLRSFISDLIRLKPRIIAVQQFEMLSQCLTITIPEYRKRDKTKADALRAAKQFVRQGVREDMNYQLQGAKKTQVNAYLSEVFD